MPEKLYNFSFDKKSATLLAAASLVLAALLVSAGYLVGATHPGTAEGPAESSPARRSDESFGPPAPVTAGQKPALQPAAPPALLAAAPVPEADNAAAPAADPPPRAAPPAPSASPQAASDLSPDAPDPDKPALATPAGRYSLQLASFQTREAAMEKLKQLMGESIVATLFVARDQAGQTWFAVRTGSYQDLISAEKAREQLAEKTGEFVIVRPARRL